MKLLKVSFLILNFLFLNFSHAADNHKVVGRLIKPRKSLNLPFEYYLTFKNSTGKVFAYPVKSSLVTLKEIEKGTLNIFEFVESKETLTVGERKDKVVVLTLLKAKPFDMKALQVSTADVEKLTPVKAPKEPTPDEPGIRINDNVAVASIFTAGAVLLGSILAGQ